MFKAILCTLATFGLIVPSLSLAQTASSEYSFINTAEAVGIESCLGAMRKIGNQFVGARPNSSSMIYSTESPNDRLVGAVTVQRFADADSHVVMSVVPVATDRCDVSLTQSFVASKACGAFHAESYADWSRQGDMIEGSNVYLHPEGTVRLVLTPAGPERRLCLATVQIAMYGLSNGPTEGPAAPPSPE